MAGSAPNPLCNQLHEQSADERIAFYLQAAKSSATRRAYEADLDAFVSWGATIPASPRTVAAYLASSSALATSTLRRRLAGLADAHRTAGYLDPTKDPLVRNVFRGICRVRGIKAKAATPIEVHSLAKIVAALPVDLAGVRDRALLLVGFFCALRRSELVNLRVEDIERGPNGRTLKIHRSKSDQCGAGQQVPLPVLASPLCPATAAARWIEAASISEGPLFRAIISGGALASSALPAAQVSRILRSRASQAGVLVPGLSAHSLRSGFAVSATRAGISTAQIQAITRHRSLAGLEPYVRSAGPPTDNQVIKLCA